MPIIVLSARTEEHDKIAALDAGADDYLSKPFGIGELQARLRVAMRRHAGAQADEPLVRFADIEVDIPARRIVRGDEELHLTPIEFRLLVVLLNNPGKVPHPAPVAQSGVGAKCGGTQPLFTHLHGASAAKAGGRSGAPAAFTDRNGDRLSVYAVARLLSPSCGLHR
ncbi:KDP operon transcriptional regulatory protein KdpE [Raoultella planticola]|uniref:KDP operon transcriptional regulatory protein KdpE n=1 Tax=Raoultella planticola TaxID=575 RepID=A0A485AT30_RAOPL|nr:KDP operon transcriptional regulatory protein KdpE [Raoultella planticola]